MGKMVGGIVVIGLCLWSQSRGPIVGPLEETGFHAIFDGTSMKGGIATPDFWRVENGEIIGETRADHQPPQNIFCIWKGGSPADFEIKMQYKLTGETGNSGVQYRSIELPDVNKWVMKGYQADIDGKQQYTGQVYEERGRGFVALRGQIHVCGLTARSLEGPSVAGRPE